MKYRNDSIVTIKEIREIIDSRNLETNIDEGIDSQRPGSFTNIEVYGGSQKLILNLTDGYRLHFADWHGHYYTEDKQAMKDFRQHLEDLLDSKMCSVGCFRDVNGVENFCGSAIEYKENLDREYFRRKYGDDKIIRCTFFNGTLNKTFMT